MDASVMETRSFRPRRPWLAALLSLLYGPVGQVYVGRARRSLGLWLVWGCLMPTLALCLSSLRIGRFGLSVLFLCVVLYPLFLATDAFLLARRDRHAVPKRYQRWWVYLLCMVGFALGNLAVACFDRSFVAEAFVVVSRSMSPTIQPGDHILVDKFWWSRDRIHRDDVVAFLSNGPGSVHYVHRVIGLPGDEIEIKNERLFVNGKKWDDRHAVFQGALPPVDALINYGPAKVPPDCCFLLGDNRRHSKDCRFTGPIPLRDVHGKARFIYWSRERIFPNPNDTTVYELGAIRWGRCGARLD